MAEEAAQRESVIQRSLQALIPVGFVKPTHLEMFQLACQVGICWPAVSFAMTHGQLSLRPTSSPSAAASKLPSSLQWYLGINHSPNPQTLINHTCSGETR